jgi:hypothetical protein
VEPSFGLKVGLTPIWVKVVAEPSLAVEINVCVISSGVDTVVIPRLLVVVTTNVVEKDVLVENLGDVRIQE